MPTNLVSEVALLFPYSTSWDPS